MIRYFTIMACCFLCQNAWSQSFTETSIDFGFGFGFSTPLADLKDRFGTMYGGDFSLNFYRGDLGSQFGFKLGFMTSDVVKEDPLAPYRTSSGQILSFDGLTANVNSRMAASYVGIDFKQNLAFIDKKERIKLFAGVGMGLMQHKIRYVDFTRMVTYASENYGKGHDRNSRGLYLEEQIGIKIRNRAKKFDVALTSFQGFLTPVGQVEFDTGSTLKEDRLDIGLGFKITWNLSLTAKEVGKDIYY